MSDMFINNVYLPFLYDDTRTQIFFGGSSSGKSVFLGQRVVLDILGGERNYLITRNIGGTIEKSVFNQVMKTIYENNLTKEFSVNRSTYTITCLRNRKQILFSGLDDVEKLKSITPIDGPITDVWMEEATESSYEAYKQLNKRLRGRSKVKKRVILSFNPIPQDHWIYNEFFG
ncbi:MAG: PBSX family phage terminase large subunit, partial [Clostridia bacterium]|nr:PBSX family phage terminase large subunit [Clostridia bacterium]